MNREQAATLIRESFTSRFNRERFGELAVNLLNRLDTTKTFSRQSAYIKDAFKPHVQRFERLGEYTAPGGERLDVLVVHLTDAAKLERARTALRNFVADHLKERDDKEAALVAFVSPSEAQWRFSYVKMEYATVQKESGKIGVESRLTPARRFSYLVGEGESCHTAQTRFLGLLANTSADPALAQIEDAFSVEAVTREFFGRYAALFGEFHAALETVCKRDAAVRKEFEAKGIATVDFAKKLLGQIVFLYFLQKKGWLGVAKGGDWGDGPHDFLRRITDAALAGNGKANIFNDVLEPLFYDTLATDRGHQAWCERFKCRIPFLNGGLFEPLGNYDWRKTDIILPNHLFTNDDPVDEGITGSGVLDVFDRYNFTVNESEPLEKEVAIDPEMLGKVFENLIEENRRKGLGAFYTPREIVHYMCQESLINYLATANADIPRADIETFIRLGEQISHYEAVETAYRIKMPRSIEKHARALDDALKSITVCDPAVGSGAFPVGMMTEIVRARAALTPYFNAVEERTPYHFKRHAIQSSLYGVDIDASAVEIAKLRLWLSLVVDEEDVRQVKPLPNLDYKIVVGNSLLGVEKDLFNQEAFKQLEALKPQFFNETDHDRKAALRQQIEGLIHELTNGREAFDYEIYFSEVFHAKQGFDVVIANPPYVRQEKIKEQKAQLKSAGYECFSGTADLLVYFYERGVKLLRKGGALTLITSNKFYRAGYGEKLREFLARELSLNQLIDFGDAPVFEAIAYASILTGVKLSPPEESAVTGYTWEAGVAFDQIARVVPERGITISQVELTPDSWRLERPEVYRLLEKLRKKGTPLGEYVQWRFYRGVLTGLNEAFVIDRETRDRLIAVHPSSSEVIKPFLRGRDVKRWRSESKDLWLIFTRRGIDITKYPAIHEHLKAYKKQLTPGIPGGRKPGSYEWYEIQDNVAYWQEFEQPKILYPDIYEHQSFAYDTNGFYSVNTTYFVPTSEAWLTALLNSLSVEWLYSQISNRIRGGYLRAFSDYMKQIPIPAASDTDKARLTKLAEQAAKQAEAGDTSALRQTERDIDQIVYRLFDLNPAEITLIESALSGTTPANTAEEEGEE